MGRCVTRCSVVSCVARRCVGRRPQRGTGGSRCEAFWWSLSFCIECRNGRNPPVGRSRRSGKVRTHHGRQRHRGSARHPSCSRSDEKERKRGHFGNSFYLWTPGDPGNYAYNASKAAVFNLVRAAAVDLGVYGIRVNGVAPGPVETGITERLKGLPGAMEEMAKRIPLRRWGQPHELAEAFFFLASPAASFITGTTLMVDGGHSAHAAHFDLRDKA